MSVVRRDKLYPKGSDAETFVKVAVLIHTECPGYHSSQALVKFKIAELSWKKAPNGNTAGVLTLTRITEDRETVRLFRNLYMKFRAINAIFDPLGIFHDVPDPDAGIRI